VNRGCSIGLMIALLIAGVVGYLGYRFANQLADLPADLSPYQHADSVRGMLKSNAHRPTDTTHLTESQLSPLLAVADSANTILLHFTSKVQALQKDDPGIIKGVGSGMELIKDARLLPLSLRRAMVSVLNQQGRSWQEYQWLKERAVAAAGITRKDADSVVHAVIRTTLGDTATAKIHIPDGEVGEFYRRADSLRASGGIDSAEFALMRPYRTQLLERGVLLLLGLESNDELDAIVSE